MSQRLKMKDLERLTGVGREAIRYYIREGLLPEPERPARNVAWYDESFVERIVLIKKLQHERFLPLAIIKAIVTGTEPHGEEEASTLRSLEAGLVPMLRSRQERPAERLSATAARLELRAAEIQKLAEAGLFEIAVRDGDQWLEGSAVTMVELWSRLRAAGFTPELGFEPSLAALYVHFIGWLAREEVRLFVRRLTGKLDAESARSMAEHAIRAVNEMLVLLHENMILRYVAEGSVPDVAAEPPAALNQIRGRC